MTFLPIVVRELRIVARRKQTHRARQRLAGYAILFAGGLVFMTGALGRGNAGAVVLGGLAAISFISCLGMAGNTVDCISSEKREGTLGFLFLTDLKGHDIALGKLFSTSLNSFYALAGTFPVVAMALLLGGVTGRDFWGVGLALLNIFFFAHTASLYVSTLSRKANYASLGLGGILMGYTVGLGLAASSFAAAHMTRWEMLVNCFNPAYCLFLSCQPAFVPVVRAPGIASGSYWVSWLVINLNAWAFLAAASWWLPRCWQEKPAKIKLLWRDRFRQWYHMRYTPRTCLLDTNAFLWLAIRNRLGSLKVWSVLLVMIGFWVWIMAIVDRAGILPCFAAAMVMIHLTLKIFMAADSSETLDEQRRSGALEFLVSGTLLSPKEIIQGQWQALRRQFLAPVITVLALDLAMIIFTHLRRTGFGDEDNIRFYWFGVQAMLLLVADLFALAALGMWHAMSRKKPRHAAGDAMAKVLLAPFFFFLLVFVIAAWLGVEEEPYLFGVLLAVWFFAGLGADAFFFCGAMRKLLTEFRSRASMLAPDDPRFFVRVGRLLGRWLRPGPRQV